MFLLFLLVLIVVGVGVAVGMRMEHWQDGTKALPSSSECASLCGIVNVCEPDSALEDLPECSLTTCESRRDFDAEVWGNAKVPGTVESYSMLAST